MQGKKSHRNLTLGSNSIRRGTYAFTVVEASSFFALASGIQ